MPVAAAKRPVKKAAKQTRPRKAQPRTPARKVGLADARQASQIRAEETGALQEGDDLPLIVVKGAPRPRARIQLGEGGPVYTVTKPKDDYYSDMLAELSHLQGLAFDNRDLSQLSEEEVAALSGALKLMEEFITCAFAPGDQEAVLAHLKSPDNDEGRQELADAMVQLMQGVWGSGPESDQA